MNYLVSSVLYLIVIILSWALMSLAYKTKQPRMGYAVASLAVVCVLGIVRYATGADYSNYLEIYQFFATGEEIGATAAYFSQVEIFFKFFAKLSYALTKTPLLFFGLPWVMTVVVLYCSLRCFFNKNDTDKIPLAWLMIMIFMIPLGFDQIRQTLAIAILTLAMVMIVKKKTQSPLVLMILAAGFHYSSLLVSVPIAILMTVWSFFKSHKYRLHFFYVLTGGLVLALMFVVALNVLKDDLENLRIYYLQRIAKHLFSDTDGFKILGFVRMNYWLMTVLSVLSVSLLLIEKKTRLLAKNQQLVRAMPMLAIGQSLIVLGFFIPFGGRLSQYFLFFAVLLIVKLLNNRQERMRAYACSTGLLILMLLCNWNWILPYQTIWNDVNLNDINRHYSPYNALICKLNKHKCMLKTNQKYDNNRLWRLK